MNEKIKQLALDANYTIIDSPVWQYQINKFIELLVLECSVTLRDLYRCDQLDDQKYIETWNSALAAAEKSIVDKFSE